MVLRSAEIEEFEAFELVMFAPVELATLPHHGGNSRRLLPS